MPRYEYMQVLLPWTNPQYKSEDAKDRTQDMLNEYGAEGWHPIYMHRDVMGMSTVYDVILEREITDEMLAWQAAMPALSKEREADQGGGEVYTQPAHDEDVAADTSIGDSQDAPDVEAVTLRMAASVLGLSDKKFTYQVGKRKLREEADWPFVKERQAKTNREIWVAPPDQFVLWVRERFPEEIAARQRGDGSDEE
ncbi:MAG: hypothetical protein HN396_10790 [Gemmatimonadales bacterium]|jgi:hypothetical protein|nr:hypothetical protein [Gemmatimonadales bacterium]